MTAFGLVPFKSLLQLRMQSKSPASALQFSTKHISTAFAPVYRTYQKPMLKVSTLQGQVCVI